MVVLTLRFLTLSDVEEDDERCEFIDEVKPKSSIADTLARPEAYFSIPLSTYYGAWSVNLEYLNCDQPDPNNLKTKH